MATKLFTVAVYHEHLAYGGPEEGGWWYRAGQIVAEFPIRQFRCEERAWAYCRRLNHWLDRIPNREQPPLSSVLSDGLYAADVHEGIAPRYFPETRPHYE